MKSTFALLLSVSFLLPPLPTQSQILRNIARRVQEKVAEQLEEKISERIAEEVTKATMRQFDNFLDSALHSEYESQRDSGNFTGTFEEFVLKSNLYDSLPPSYAFDYQLDITLVGYNGDTNEVVMLLSQDQPIMGYLQKDPSNDQQGLMVTDGNNLWVAGYNLQDKEVYVMSLRWAKALQNNVPVVDDTKITKTGKTKRILGYKTSEWLIEDSTTITRAFIAEDFPVTWENIYEAFSREIMPVSRRDKMPKGIVFESVTRSKETDEVSSYTTTAVRKKAYVVHNEEYSPVTTLERD